MYAAETVPQASRGYDAGKKINGRKRHITVDTIGMLLIVAVSDASVQDRESGRALVRAARAYCRNVPMTWAAIGYSGAVLNHPRPRTRRPPSRKLQYRRLGWRRRCQ